ncbi:hypothetical protein GB937_008803 [Aspergillus fischeri]|nr:hypothetical protein GB937_008803 [Aspergillus fischeri]
MKLNFRELVLKELVGFRDASNIFRDEEGTFVRVVAEDDWHPDELALMEKAICIVGHEVFVDSRPVHVQRRLLRSRERRVEVLALKACCIKIAQTRECVVFARTAGADDQVVGDGSSPCAITAEDNMIGVATKL